MAAAISRWGLRSRSCLPKIDYDKIDQIRGLDITISTTAGNDEAGLALLRAFNFPFRSQAA